MTLELQAITRVSAGQAVLQRTNLVLEGGTMNLLLGPTLAGKTSLRRVMAGLDMPQ